MKKYLVILFQNNYLIFTHSDDEQSPENIINTNQMFHNKLIYTSRYYKKNFKTIVNFVNIQLPNKKIDTAYVEDEFLVLKFLEFLRHISIKILFIKNFKALNIEECNSIINNKYLTYINCYYIPYAYLVKMKEQKRKIYINYQESISDDFMIKQDVIDSEAIYYKKVLHFKGNFQLKIKDFLEFLNLNVYLKTIHLHSYNKELIENIIKSLKKCNREDIVILLYQGNNEFIQNNFEYLKKVNKNFSKELNGEIRIVYSSKFVRNNLFNQLTYNNIKMSMVVVLYVVLIGLTFTKLYEYVSKVNIDKLNYELYANNNGSSINKIESTIEGSSNSAIEEPKPKYVLDKSFVVLKKINSDVVGWLTVNNTNVDYPIVQSTNNDYYLKRDIYKTWTSQGWVFMDYRNDAINISDNTIIYGHKLKNGLMFGTLDQTLKRSWYTNPDNQIITFNIPAMNMKWQIFSIYRTDYTTDYLVTNFYNADSYNKFTNMLINRSIYDFGQTLEYGDKILTLSTCIGYSSANQRMVIHAKLIGG